jgi:CHAD domain-containing protein
VARARDVPGLECDKSFEEAAARVVSVRAAEVFEHAGGVLDTTDPERVHDMRVATRRLRAALEVFAPCFPRKRHRRALKRVKRLADALGERRDRDVSIELLEELASETAAGEEPARAALVEGLRDEQWRANEELAPFLAPRRLRKLDRRLRRLVEAAR